MSKDSDQATGAEVETPVKRSWETPYVIVSEAVDTDTLPGGGSDSALSLS